MHFKKIIVLVVLLCMGQLGCGKFGKNPDRDAVLRYGSEMSNCLKQFKTDLADYLNGKVDETRWSVSSDCVLSSLDRFQKNVRASEAEGYTQGDLKNFLGKFLMKDREISDELIEVVFELKAFLFGGNSTHISSLDLGRLVDFLRKLKEESMVLLPHFERRANNPSIKDIVDFAHAIEKAAVSLAEKIALGTEPYKIESAERLVTEIAKFTKRDISKPSRELISAIKVLLVAGKPNVLEPDSWKELFKLLGGYGGVALALKPIREKTLIDIKADSSEYRGAAIALVAQAIRVFEQTINKHGGGIVFTLIDDVINHLPEDAITIDRKALTSFLRPLVNKLLWNKNRDQIDSMTTAHIFRMIEDWHLSQLHLEAIFRNYGLNRAGISLGAFLKAARNYLGDLKNEQDIALVTRLTELAQSFRPLFLEHDSQIAFTAAERFSFNHFTHLHPYRTLVDLLGKSYGNPAEKDRLSFDKFAEFIEDIKEIAHALKVMDPDVANVSKRHFANINLFTWKSNGDQYVDLDEATYYLAFLLSAKGLSKRLREVIEPICKVTTLDPLGWFWMDAQCFRKEYLKRRYDLWDHFPGLIQNFENLNQDDKDLFLTGMEQGARRYGHTEQPFGSYDTDAVATIMHFVESVVTRFDHDNNQLLNVDEVLEAYPVFKNKLANFAEIDPSRDFLLQGALTYVVKHGVGPKKGSYWDTAHFLLWVAQRPFWSFESGRDKIFRVLGVMNKPEALPGTENVPISTPSIPSSPYGMYITSPPSRSSSGEISWAGW